MPGTFRDTTRAKSVPVTAQTQWYHLTDTESDNEDACSTLTESCKSLQIEYKPSVQYIDNRVPKKVVRRKRRGHSLPVLFDATTVNELNAQANLDTVSVQDFTSQNLAKLDMGQPCHASP
eukprot:7189937-Karenia_brevis.AAC.1